MATSTSPGIWDAVRSGRSGNDLYEWLANTEKARALGYKFAACLSCAMHDTASCVACDVEPEGA